MSRCLFGFGQSTDFGGATLSADGMYQLERRQPTVAAGTPVWRIALSTRWTSISILLDSHLEFL
jgi:hypothetical protein